MEDTNQLPTQENDQANDQANDQENDQENATVQFSPAQPSIDKITMELMMNRSHYKKYLLKQDPQKFQEVQEYTDKIHKYSDHIESLFTELLIDSMKINVTEKHTHALNDSFREFVKSCIQHFELKELERTDDPTSSSASIDDTDVLFDTINDTPSSTSWGKPIKKSTYYTMDMYMNKSSTKK